MRLRWLPCLLALCVVGCGSNGSPTGPSKNVPNYSGNWRGTYTVTGCNETGGISLANVCRLVGNAPPFTLTLTQSQRNVSGSFTLGSINFPNTGGTVSEDGSLGLNATSVSDGITIVVTWSLNLPSTALTGTVSQIWTSTTLSGQANVVGTISTATR